MEWEGNENDRKEVTGGRKAEGLSLEYCTRKFEGTGVGRAG